MGQPSSRTGENPPYGMSGGIEETSASFEARSAPRSYPTEDRPTRALGKAGRPGSDRHELKPAIILELLHHGPERVQVRHHRPRGTSARTFQRGSDRSPAGELKRHPEPFELMPAEVHDLVCVPRGAWEREKPLEKVEQVIDVDPGPPRGCLERLVHSSVPLDPHGRNSLRE